MKTDIPLKDISAKLIYCSFFTTFLLFPEDFFVP